MIICSCSTTNLQFNKDTDIAFQTSSICTQDNRKFHVRNTEIDQVRNCIEKYPNLDCEEVILDSLNKTTINAREIIQSAKPLKEIIRKFPNFKINYEIGVDPKGNVVIVRVVNYEGTISEEQANKSGLNLMNMKFEPDINAHALKLGNTQ